MIIDDLPVLPSKPATGDELVIERGQSTYKVGYDDLVGNSLSALQSGIAIIVSGDRASMAVPVGGYAYIKNNTHRLAEGLYINTSSNEFSAVGGIADDTVFTPVSGGGLNAIQQSLAVVNVLNDIQVHTNCTLQSAVRYGKIVEIVGNIAGNAVNGDAFTIPQTLRPLSNMISVPTMRNSSHGTIFYIDVYGDTFRYLTEATFANEQHFHIVYLIQ